MAWEDSQVRYIESLIEAADNTSSKESAKQDLIHALNAAEVIGNDNLVALIKNKLEDL